MEGGGRQKGVTLGSILTVNRTLLDIIRQEEPNRSVYETFIGNNKKGWKSFKDKRPLRCGLDGIMWAAGVPVPVSDVPFRNEIVSSSNNGMVMGAGSESNQRPALSQLLRARSVHVVEQVQDDDDDDDSGEVPWAGTSEVRSLNHYLPLVGSSDDHFPVSNASGPNVSRRSSILRRNLSSIPSTSKLDRPVSSLRLSDALAAEREHMQTVVVSTTVAAISAQNEAEVPETNNYIEQQVHISEEVANEEPQVRMSLMDLLEDSDSRQIGRSSFSGDVECYTGNIDEGSEFAAEDEGSNFVEQACCVCMVRHKGSAFIPCGHTFCRLCSRKLWVNRGSCPLCNGFILEILDIF